ncbi:MAG TPA: DUF2807 domain-containing protein [Rhizomicrobium sp.]|jgi:hypothetical protein
MKHFHHSPILAVLLAGFTLGAGAHAQTVVPAPPFSSIELEGGGHIVLKHGNTQQIRLLKGSTEFTRFIVEERNPGKLRIEACNKDCPHQYDLEIEITTPDIQGVAISGGGAIESGAGFPAQHNLSAAVEGGGRIDMRAMSVANATAAVDGGGKIMIKADDELTAAIHGGGSIRYWGSPKVTEAVEGGGEVKQGG